jgi:predicted Zn-dependent protease
MDLKSHCDIASRALRRCQPLGFDLLEVMAIQQRLYGVRIAQSVICRENVAKEQWAFGVEASWRGRQVSLICQEEDDNGLVERIRKLRKDIESQPVDEEFVLPNGARGHLVWDVAPADFDELYGPAALYPAIERHAARARGQGLRVTGYLEAQEIDKTTFVSQGLTLRTRDSGLTISLTVDDPKTGAVGSTARASVHADAAELDRLIGEALDEAVANCQAGARPRELTPGDYTVVLHPQAVQDVLGTALMYGMFDRRKVDEGRTYLSRKVEELAFPAGLHLTQTLNLPLPGGKIYADLPLNGRHVPCASVELIDEGRIRDLHCSPYWARKLGIPETFVPFQAPPLLLEARVGSGLAGKHQKLEDLIASTERGIYVANTWYLRMVAEMDGVITGMTRDGVFEIRDGKLAGPVLNMRWHDNPLRMLQAVSGITEQRTVLGRARLSGHGRAALAAIPALRIENFHFSSVTKF